MDGNTLLINDLQNGNTFNPNENVFEHIWKEYERVIVESLITSFGLDFIVKDSDGGDVDTIHNVRNQKESDGNFIIKNDKANLAYQNRGKYNSDDYHSDDRYRKINKKFSEKKKNGTLKDSYSGQNIEKNAKIDLDHVISAKEIHDDPARILAGLKGTDLANCEDNLKPTNRSINRSMKDKNIEEYLINWEENKYERKQKIAQLKSKNQLSDKERKELEKLEQIDSINPDIMRHENEKARKNYNKKINQRYYLSNQFLTDTAKAAGKKGMMMGLRQALGLVLAEIWFVTRDEIKKLPPGIELKEILETAGNGVEKGIQSAKSKYKEIIERFFQGAGAGALASLTTTICNIFFTTAKNLVKCIRQAWASVVQAGKVLLFNPDNLYLGDRIKAATVILATGASVLVGTAVGELISDTPIGAIPVIGDIVQSFCGALISGLLSCSLLICLDRSKTINRMISILNAIPSEANNFAEIAKLMELIAAKLEAIDIEKFAKETEQFNRLSILIDNSKNDEELNVILHNAYREYNIALPWKGDFDDFMRDKNNHLVFE